VNFHRRQQRIPRWSVLCLAGALTLTPTAALGTAIGVVRTSEELVIAVDSRVSTATGAPKADACKIHVFNETIAVTHGIMNAPGFDLREIVAGALDGAANLRTNGDRIVWAATEPFRAALERLRVDAPTAFRHVVQNGIGTGAVLARWEAGAPRLALVGLRPRLLDSTTLDLEPIVSACQRFDCGRETFLSSLRQMSRAERERQYLTFSSSVEPPAEAVIAFVESEIAKDNRRVGPPVQAIRVTREGITWLKRDGPCLGQPKH